MPGKRTFVLTDPDTKEQEFFKSSKEIAEYLNVAHKTVMNYINSGRKLRGKWIDTTDKEVYYLREEK